MKRNGEAMRIAIVGKGHVGNAIASGVERLGHEVRFGHRDPNETVEAATKWGELIVLAVPYHQMKSAANEIGSRGDGKTLIDTTNPVGPNGELAAGCTTSASEELQHLLPRAKVVKAFNTVFAQNQSTGKVGGQPLAAFIAGDDAGAKKAVMELTRGMGFEPLDCGPLASARYLEPMAMQIIALAYGQGMGASIGYRLVKG
jgi:predicted dinucleotide-binding enzyme